jgi:hypothetical protein
VVRAVTTLHEIEESLRNVEPDTLREMAYQTAQSHVAVCGLTSQIGDCAHIDMEEIRDRVGGLTGSQLAAILAPTAWLSIEIHRNLPG